MNVEFWKWVDDVSDYDPVRSIGEGKSRWCQVPYSEASCFTWAAPTGVQNWWKDRTEWVTDTDRSQWQTLFQALQEENLLDEDMPTQHIPYHKLVQLIQRGKAIAVPQFIQGALKAIALIEWKQHGDCELTRNHYPQILRDLPVEPVYAGEDWDYLPDSFLPELPGNPKC